MNRSDLRAEIRRMLRDSNSSNYRFSDSVLNTRIDIANARICSLTQCLETLGYLTVTADTQEISLPSDFLTERYVLYKGSDGNYTRLQKITEQELDIYDPDHRNVNGTPGYYYLRTTKVGLYPIPDATTASGLKLEYIKRPAALSADSDYPLGGVSAYYPYHQVVSYDVVRRCMLDDAKVNDANVYEGEFQRGVAELRAQIWRQNDETRLVNAYEQDRATSRRLR